MANTLGQMIGIVVDNFSITNNSGDTAQLRIKWDFNSASDNDIKSWLCGNRRIVFQRPTRALSIDEINELDGTTILATSAGRKMKSRQERIDELASAFKASGIDDTTALTLATAAVDNPSTLTTIDK